MARSRGPLGRVLRPLAAALVVVGLAVAIAGAMMLWSRSSSPAAMARTLDAVQPWLLAWRLTLFALLIGLWPTWVDLLSRRRGLHEAQRERLVGARWTVALWCVVLELVLAQNVIGRAINLMTGGHTA